MKFHVDNFAGYCMISASIDGTQEYIDIDYPVTARRLHQLAKKFQRRAALAATAAEYVEAKKGDLWLRLKN